MRFPATASNKLTHQAVIKGNGVLQHTAAISLGLFWSFKSFWFDRCCRKIVLFQRSVELNSIRSSWSYRLLTSFYIPFSCTETEMSTVLYLHCSTSKCIYSHSLNGKCLFETSPFQAVFWCKMRITKALQKKITWVFFFKENTWVLVCWSQNFKLLESWSGVHLNWRRRYSVIVLFLYSCITPGMSFPFTLGFGELCLILKENWQNALAEGDINSALMLFHSLSLFLKAAT